MLTGGTVAAVTLLSDRNEETLSEEHNEIGNVNVPMERIRLKLTPLLTDKAGVNIESGFKLILPKGIKLDEKVIQEKLEVIPALDFIFEKVDDGLVIKPKKVLQSNKVYTFKINLPEQNIKESWAFQTRREFKIVSVLPGNKETNVPLNTGIEIVFSHSNIKDFEKNFSINPKVEGTFELHKNIAVFVPKELTANTIYTATIGRGVSQADSKEALKEDYSFSFQTQTEVLEQKPEDSYLSVYNGIYNFPSDVQPVLEIGASNDFKGKDLAVSVYRYDTVDTFIKDYDAINEKPSWAVIDRNQYIPDVSGLTPFKSYTQPLTYLEENSYMSYLALPENLQEGHYLLIFKCGDKQDYSFIQINDMQLYMSMEDEKTLVWLNDMLTGQPVSGAVFEGNNIKPATTGNDGTAFINEKLSKDESGRTLYFKAIRDGHPTLVAPVYYSGPDWGYYSEIDNKSNWNTLYLDRRTYIPTDTAKIWGYLRPRSGGNPPKSVTVNLIKHVYDYNTYENSKEILETKEVMLTANGSYTTEFHFENLPSSNYYIEIESSGVTVCSSYFFVNKYIKSQYIVTADPEYKAYFAGENFKADVAGEFFEGTPVTGYEMNYYVRSHTDYLDIESGSLTLDTQGRAEINFALPNDTGTAMPSRPLNQTLCVNNKNPEETEVSDYKFFCLFPRDIMVQTDVDFKDATAKLHFKTNSIDINAVRKTGEFYNAEGDALFEGYPIERNLQVTLYERYWDKKVTGEYYDIIAKENGKTYEYFEVNNSLKSFEVKTVGGVADYILSIPNYSAQKSYYILCETMDTLNRPIREETWLYAYNNYWYGYGYDQDYYHLEFEDTEARYKIGEPINFSLKRNNNESIDGGNILYMVLQNGVKDLWVSKDSEQSITFIEDYMPNINIQAVYFDGRLIKTAYERSIRFDYGEKELDVLLKTDKESYEPGETVNALLTVKDIAGNPIEADVNLSVVDEAYFDLYDQNVDTCADLYKTIYDTGIWSTYISYNDTSDGPGGAEGGEGDDQGGKNNVRKNFLDNAFFDSVVTDSKGLARISFKLPDNLTSWRLTYQAVTDNLMAGNGKKNITTRLPFFIKTLLNDTFMLGDAPTLLLKGYGEGVKAQDEVAFKATLKNADGSSQNFEAKGKINEYTEINLPKLDEGIYTVMVEGRSGKLSDAVEKTIQVRKSLLLAKQMDFHNLSPDFKLDNMNGYATLSFFNADLNDYYRSLLNLYWSYGNRLDQIVARNVAQELLKQNFSDGYFAYGEKADINPYQKEDGGFALLPYGSSDVELSAKMAALCAMDVNAESLSSYFSAIINDPKTTPLQCSAAYWGMASLREPVLLELQGFIKQGDMTLIEKLYLANALAELGDLTGAEKLYEEISKDYGVKMEPYRYIDDNGDKDDIQRFTSLMAILAVKVDAKDSMAYFKYIEHNSVDEILINLERLILVKQGLPDVSKSSNFIMEIDGQKETIMLSGTKTYTRMLSPEKLKTVEFSQIKGDVALSVSYETLQDPAKTSDPVVTINRTYNKSSDSPVKLERTDLVTIELSISFSEAAPEGYYEVTDVLPAGLRYIYPYQSEVDQWYFGEPDGQCVKLGCYYDGKTKNRIIVYQSRVAAPGDYIADSALIKHSESNARGYSKKASIRIE